MKLQRRVLTPEVDYIPFPNCKYNVIYADPPWSFSSKELNNLRPLTDQYVVQDASWIASLPVESIADKDCALFMWSTDAHLKEALDIIELWGFKYITVAFVWDKKTIHGKQATNIGAWTVKNCELCLLGTRGQMLKYKKSNKVHQKVVAARTRHSRKPDVVRQNIEQLFGDIPRIELFARERFENWDAWGNEI